MARWAARTGRQDETVALVLSGGIALGAYQAGAYAVMHERGMRPRWIAGSSIGAVNAAIIAGNPPETQVEQLRRFWEAASSDLVPSGPLSVLPPAEGPWRHAHNWMSVVQARLFGRPGLFRPRPLAPGSVPGGSVGVYDLAPLRERLEQLVDFERLNGGGIRLSVATTDVATGEEVVFDTRHGTRLEPAHLLASCGLLPDFPRPRSTAGFWVTAGWPPMHRSIPSSASGRRSETATCCASSSSSTRARGAARCPWRRP